MPSFRQAETLPTSFPWSNTWTFNNQNTNSTIFLKIYCETNECYFFGSVCGERENSVTKVKISCFEKQFRVFLFWKAGKKCFENCSPNISYLMKQASEERSFNCFPFSLQFQFQFDTICTLVKIQNIFQKTVFFFFSFLFFFFWWNEKLFSENSFSLTKTEKNKSVFRKQKYLTQEGNGYK